MKRNICNDLKTERADGLPPLPAVVRLLPIGFYAAVIGTIVLSGFFYLQLKQAESDKQKWLSMEQSEKSQQDNIAKSMKMIAAKEQRGEEVRRMWPFLRDRRIDAYGGLEHRFLD